jgi:hypothetical protein
LDVRMIGVDALASSSPEDVATYLRVHGWQQDYSDLGGSAWIRASDVDTSEPIELWVPRSETMRSYATRVGQLLDALSDFEDRSPAQILFEMTHVLQDIQRVHSYPRGTPGTTPLIDCPEAVDGLRRWVLSGAASVAAPEPVAVQPTRKPPSVDAFMQQVRLVVPELGSFVWKIAVPLAAQDGEQPLPFPDAVQIPRLYSFNRRVTLQLYMTTSSVLDACKRVREGADVLPAFQEVVERGVSANLCEALAATGSGDRRTPFDLTFAWASEMPNPQSTTLQLQAEDLEIVEEAGRQLREIAPEEDMTVRGYIVRLLRESDQRPGQVTIYGTVQGEAGERVGHFWAELSDLEYNQAIEAHGKHDQVTIVGDLIRRGSRNWLGNARDFRVLPSGP